MRIIDTVNLAITSRCNRACPDCCCGIPGRKRHADYGWTYFANAARFLRGIHRVNLTGGEPTIHRDFDRIAHEFRALFGCERLTMETNGHGLEPHRDLLPLFDEIYLTVYPGDEFPGLPANVKVRPASHISRQRNGSGTCHRADGGAVSYWNGKLYPCCIGPGVGGAVGIELSEDWREQIVQTPMPCGSCWMAGSDEQ